MAGLRSRHRYHCRECRRQKKAVYRFTMAHSLDRYVRKPNCPNCGTTDYYSYEEIYRKKIKKRDMKNRCTCEGLPFPHIESANVLCLKCPQEKLEGWKAGRLEGWTEEDLMEYKKRMDNNFGRGGRTA